MGIRQKLVILTACFLLSGIFFGTQAYGETSRFDTTAFDVKIDVKENNSMLITEKITVDFQTARHGIFRTIPLRGTAYYMANEKQVSLDSSIKVDQIEVKGYPFKSKIQGGSIAIEIGDPDKTVTGKHTYTLSYRVRAFEDGIPGYDIFYYNVLPSEWESGIQSANIQIQMPKSFEQKSLDVYAGAYGTNRYADSLNVDVKGNSIHIKTMEALPERTGITVLQMLPEGYFVNVMNTDWAYDAMLLIGVLAAIVAFLLWLFFGRDRKMIRPVEFYPPEDISSAELGYVVDGKVDKRDIISLIISFADRGNIRIEDNEKEGFILHKEKELPDSAEDFEQIIFSALFPLDGMKVRKLSDMPEDFYDSFMAAAIQIKSRYTGDTKKRLYEKSGNVARVVGALLMMLPVGAGLFFGSIFAKEEGGLYVALPVCVFLFLLYFCGMILYDRREGIKTGLYVVLNIALAIVSAVNLLVAASIIFYYTDVTGAILAVICSVVAYVCTRQMRRKTVYGNKLVGRLLGFKHFIKVAELKKLQLLVEEDPNYFYKLLPYVYAFNLSNKWARNFASIDIKPPAWYDGGYGEATFNTWVFMNTFNSCTNSMQSHISIPSSFEGGSGSSSSFGSFGGGGGFSGGGFGGGGGGAW